LNIVFLLLKQEAIQKIKMLKQEAIQKIKMLKQEAIQKIKMLKQEAIQKIKMSAPPFKNGGNLLNRIGILPI